MILKIEDWEFDLDTAATKTYSDAEAEEHCTCGYCRNFYAAVESTYPSVKPFLGRFGLNVFGPDELIPYEAICCDVSYGVAGRIKHVGKMPIQVDGVSIIPEEWEQVNINTGCPKPCFVLTVQKLQLPWVLDEPMDDVASPAKEPSFLRKVWSRLVKKQNQYQ